MGRNVIIGAGPAGISCAYELAKKNINSLLIEKEDTPYGICKTIEYKGFRFDIGGHRFFTKSKLIEDLWKDLLREDFLFRKRFSHIYFKEKFFLYPIKIEDVFKKLGIGESFLIFLDYLYWKLLFWQKEEVSFEDWIIKHFGRRLYKMFFKTYTEKIWGIRCDEISSLWASQRIKGLSFFSVLRNALWKDREGKIKTLLDGFYYPKYGVGQMYEKMLNRVRKDTELWLNSFSIEIEIDNKRVRRILVKRGNSSLEWIKVKNLVSSMPFSNIFELFRPHPPQEVLEKARELRYRSLIEVCLIVEGRCPFQDQWIYIHDPKIRAGRLQIYKNWSPYMTKEESGLTNIGMEYFCFEGDDLWVKKDSEILALAVEELDKIGLFKEMKVIDGFIVRVEYAYPVYDTKYRENIKDLIDYVNRIENLYVIGRCGMHRYNNMDHSILTGIYAARNIIEESKKYDVWEVNVNDDEYIEEIRR